MMAPLLAVVEDLVREGVIIPPERSGLEPGEVVMYLLSVIRMLTDTGSGPARGTDRTPAEIGALAADLVLRGIGNR
jgi:hypothetical protein